MSFKSIITLLTLLLACLPPPEVKAQELSIQQDGRHKVGFMTEYGFRRIGSLLDLANCHETNYYYKVVSFQLEYHYVLVVPKRKWEIELVGQPQLNMTNFRRVDWIDKASDGYELGFTGGIMARRHIHKRVSLYSYLCSGPLYVPYIPNRQASGFIFSDNFYIGSSLELHKNVFLEIRPGFRHISNAGLKSPNPGINDMTFSMGLLARLDNHANRHYGALK